MSTHRVRAISVVLIAACTATGLAACTGNSVGKQDTTLVKGGTYTTSLLSDPGNLNPLKAAQNTTNDVISYAYDSLVNLDQHNKVIPQLATRWSVSPTTVRFTLRNGVSCSDGTKLTASAVAANFDWIKNPKNGSSYLGSGLPNSNYTVTADNAAHTVTITLDKAYGFLLEGAGLIPIVCPKGLANPKLLARGTDGTGPFVLTHYASDNELTMTVRKGYRWGPNGAGSGTPGFPAKVVFRVVQDPSTATNLFLAGKLNDVTPTGPDAGRVKRQGFFTLKSESGPVNLFFNQRSGATADPAVRKALTTALDLDTLTKVLTQNEGTRAAGLTALTPRPCRADTTSAALPHYNTQAAAALLDRAGWTKGSSGTRAKSGHELAVTVSYATGDSAFDSAMELVSQEWKKLGVAVHLGGQRNNAFIQTLFGGSTWDATFLSVQIAYPTEFVPYATGPKSPSGQNFAAIDNDEYRRLSARASATPGNAGCSLWAKAEKALFRSFDVVPIADTVTTTYARSTKYTAGFRSTVEPTSIRLYEK